MVSAVDGGDYSSVLHQLLSAGWPCLSKKEGRDGEEEQREERNRKAFNTVH